MIQIPKPLEEMNLSLVKSKQTLTRLMKGQSVIKQAFDEKSLTKAFEGVLLFNKLAMELNDELERALFMHECLTTGKTILINREGRPINVENLVEGESEPIDLWTLNSIKIMKETFGEDAIIDVNFK